MNPSKRIFPAFSHIFPAALLAKASGLRTLLPYQHVVSDDYLPHIKGLYDYKKSSQLAADLDWLLARFRPLHPDQFAAAAVSGEPLPARSFLFSFDDGF